MQAARCWSAHAMHTSIELQLVPARVHASQLTKAVPLLPLPQWLPWSSRCSRASQPQPWTTAATCRQGPHMLASVLQGTSVVARCLMSAHRWCTACRGLPSAHLCQVALTFQHGQSLPTCTLQAFRHLYVLAVQPRSVDAIDVDTKQARWPCCAQLLRRADLLLPHAWSLPSATVAFDCLPLSCLPLLCLAARVCAASD